jgi:undecaprenyl pyrophosphate synthase
MTDESAAVLELERRRCDAIAAGDSAALRQILAEDYLHVFGTGPTTNRSGYIDTIERGPRRPVRGELQVRVYGDAAVVTGDLINHIQNPDKTTRVVNAFCTQVAVKRDGAWQFVSFQLTPKRTL